MLLEGFEVYDAKKPTVLHVRPADIAAGTPKDPINCAAAKTAVRLPDVIEARVYRSRAYLLKQNQNGKKYWERYIVPGALRGEQLSYDRGSFFDPGDYPLNTPNTSNSLGADQRKWRKPTKKKGVGVGSSPRPRHVVKGMRESGPRGGYHKTPFHGGGRKKAAKKA